MNYSLIFLSLFLTPFLYAMEVSYTLVDVSNNKIVESKKQDRPMVLASLSKLYSFYYVLNKLDSNKTFKTEIFLGPRGKIKNGILEGDLFIQSNGDPYVTAQNYLDLIYQIKAKGIEKVNGNFYVSINDHWYTERLSPLGLEDQADNPSMGALNFEFNRFKVDKNTHSPIPPMSYLNILPKKINSPGLKFKLSSKTDQGEYWLKNSKERQKLFEEVPTRDSLLFSAHFFRYLADLHGLRIPTPKKVEVAKGQIIATHIGLPLYRLIELGLEYSNNLIAEMLLQAVSPSNPKTASEKMLSWYKLKYPGKNFNWQKTEFVNSSGMTLDNKTTSKNLSFILAKMFMEKGPKRNFLSYLSINGHSGGVRKRLRSPKNSFKVYAKTGSLFFVNNLAGYFRGNSGKLFAFSIFTSDDKMRNILKLVNSKKVNQVRKKSKAWHSRSTIKIDSLLAKFIEKY